jgi:hypothetical protein
MMLNSFFTGGRTGCCLFARAMIRSEDHGRPRDEVNCVIIRGPDANAARMAKALDIEGSSCDVRDWDAPCSKATGS